MVCLSRLMTLIQNLFCVREGDAGAVCSRIGYRFPSKLLQMHGMALLAL